MALCYIICKLVSIIFSYSVKAKLLGTSCPGYELSWVRVVLGTSRLGYKLSWVRVVHNPISIPEAQSFRKIILGYDHTVTIRGVAPLLLYSSDSNNTLRHSDAIWQHISGSTVTRIMDFWLRVPSHYLKQYWLMKSAVKWNSLEVILQKLYQPPLITKMSLNVTSLKLH